MALASTVVLFGCGEATDIESNGEPDSGPDSGPNSEPDSGPDSGPGIEPDIEPNIVVIIIDDLGWVDTAVYGSTFYETPNIDRLAAQGALFSQFYAAASVCSPTRASLMTGKYPARLGITTWIGDRAGRDWKRNTQLLPAAYTRRLDHGETMLAEALRAAGYRTGFYTQDEVVALAESFGGIDARP